MNRVSFDLFEQMHYVCFHYEFEHGGFDPDEECDDGGCPSTALSARPSLTEKPSGTARASLWRDHGIQGG